MQMIELTEKQLKQFEKLWFVYGNDGKKCTLLNHKLVQGFYEYGENRIDAYRDGNKNMAERFGQEYADKNGVTEDCIRACQQVLDMPEDCAAWFANGNIMCNTIPCCGFFARNSHPVS